MTSSMTVTEVAGPKATPPKLENLASRRGEGKHASTLESSCKGKLCVNTSWGLASSPTTFLPLPDIWLPTLILFLDASALGHFPSLQSTGETRAKPTTGKRAKGPSQPAPPLACPPSRVKASSTRLPPASRQPEGEPQAQLASEEIA